MNRHRLAEERSTTCPTASRPTSISSGARRSMPVTSHESSPSAVERTRSKRPRRGPRARASPSCGSAMPPRRSRRWGCNWRGPLGFGLRRPCGSRSETVDWCLAELARIVASSWKPS